MPAKIKPRISVARVIVDSRDASRDYLMLADRARQLYLAGELSRTSVYATGEDYCDPQGRYRREAVRML